MKKNIWHFGLFLQVGDLEIGSSLTIANY